MYKYILSRRDYERFGIEVPEFAGYEDLEQDLTECEEIWGLYEKYDQGNPSAIPLVQDRARSVQIILKPVIFLRLARILRGRVDDLPG